MSRYTNKKTPPAPANTANTSAISSVGIAENGAVFAAAETTLADGTYPARVVYRQTQVLRLLFR